MNETERGALAIDLTDGFVEAREGAVRVIRCGICGQNVPRSVVPHMKSDHPTDWTRWVDRFIELRAAGYPYKKIMWEFRRLFSWSVIRREIFPNDPLLFGQVKVTEYEPKDFRLEETTLWRFPRRGDWATHVSQFPGNWPPQVPRNLIMRFSKANDLVLDPFVGGGTTLIECLLLGRHGIGVDTNPAAINISRGRIEGLKEAARSQRYSLPKVKTVLTLGDARDLHFIRSGAVSLICAHPPYLGSIKYSKWIHNDLSRITQPTEYLKEFDKIASEFLRILRPGGYCAIMLGDVRKEGKYIPLGLRAMRVFEENAFRLEELVIKDQERASFDEFYSKKSFLRIAHEYVLVFRK